jgi:hypothetical protein
MGREVDKMRVVVPAILLPFGDNAIPGGGLGPEAALEVLETLVYLLPVV